MRICSKLSVKFEYFDLFYVLVFFYFFTLCADYLNVQITLFKFKVNNLLAVSLLATLIMTRKSIFVHKSVLLPFLYLLGSILLSTLLGVHKFRSTGYLFAFVFEFVCYFLIPFNLMYRCDRRKIFTVYLFAFKCLGTYAILQLVFSIFGIHDPFVDQWIAKGIARPNAFAYEPSYYALCVSSFVMFYNATFLLRNKGKSENFSFPQFLFVNLFLLVSTSTGGFFAYFIFVFVCLWFYRLGYVQDYAVDFRSNLKKITGIIASFIGFLGLVSFDLLSRYYLKFFITGFGHGSFGDRWRGIVNAWSTFLDRPIFGVGLGGVGPYLYQKHTGHDPTALSLRVMESYDPTNVLTEVLASLGMIGMCGFIWLGFWIFRLFRSVIHSENVLLQDKKIAIALFISLVVVMIQLQFSQGLFRNYIWAHVGIISGYLASLRKEHVTS